MYETLLDVSALVALMHTSRLKIFDCRFNLADTRAGACAYAHSHIPGASYLHLDQDLASPPTAQSGRHPLPDPIHLVQRLALEGVSQDHQVVVYDDTGGSIAARAWWLLRWLGYQQVAVLNGGWQAWLDAGQAVTAERPNPATPLSKPHLHLQKQAYLSTLAIVEQQGKTLQLIDARAAERFRGEQEPLDPVAGHIPGAFNRPQSDNLQAGYFKDPAQLRTEWLALLGPWSAEQIVHQCGSGVTACHNLLAMEYAGLHGSRLYAGSWSEWIRDPSRPIATGA